MTETTVSTAADQTYTKLVNNIAAAASAAAGGDYVKVRAKLQKADSFADALIMAGEAFAALNAGP